MVDLFRRYLRSVDAVAGSEGEVCLEEGGTAAVRPSGAQPLQGQLPWKLSRSRFNSAEDVRVEADGRAEVHASRSGLSCFVLSKTIGRSITFCTM